MWEEEDYSEYEEEECNYDEEDVPQEVVDYENVRDSLEITNNELNFMNDSSWKILHEDIILDMIICNNIVLGIKDYSNIYIIYSDLRRALYLAIILEDREALRMILKVRPNLKSYAFQIASEHKKIDDIKDILNKSSKSNLSSKDDTIEQRILSFIKGPSSYDEFSDIIEYLSEESGYELIDELIKHDNLYGLKIALEGIIGFSRPDFYYIIDCAIESAIKYDNTEILFYLFKGYDRVHLIKVFDYLLDTKNSLIFIDL